MPDAANRKLPAPLDVTLCEGRGIGEAAAVEDVEGIQVQRPHRQQAVWQLNALHALVVVPAREVLGILIDDIKAEASAVAVEIQLVVTVLAHQLGRIERRTERKAEVADSHAERRLPVGFQLRVEVLGLPQPLRRRGESLSLNLCSRHIHPRPDRPLRCRPCDVGCVDIALTIVQCQDAVSTLKDVLRRDMRRRYQKHYGQDEKTIVPDSFMQ